jgi:hypothetical protein
MQPSITLVRPASDSNINYTINNTGDFERNCDLAFPDTPNGVTDWIRRHSEASRRPPRPVQTLVHQSVYELDAVPALRRDEDDEAFESKKFSRLE